MICLYFVLWDLSSLFSSSFSNSLVVATGGPGQSVLAVLARQLLRRNMVVWPAREHAASSGLVASPNPIAAIPFARASGKGLL